MAPLFASGYDAGFRAFAATLLGYSLGNLSLLRGADPANQDVVGTQRLDLIHNAGCQAVTRYRLLESGKFDC